MAALASGGRIFSTLLFVKRHRNGCAGVGRILLLFSMLPSVKRHRNGCAGAREPIFALFSTLLLGADWFPF
jgi:hypothetical protein